MKRREFVDKTVTVGIGAFISGSSLEAFGLNRQRSPSGFEWIDSKDIIPCPDNPSQWTEWRKELHRWRENKKLQLNYDGSSYRSASYHWVTSDFACCFIMMCDSVFYNNEEHDYGINQLIDEGKKQYGGYDSVVLWHAYPRIGLDNRNQFDFYREMPSGLEGLKKVVSGFHQSGIKVFINYNPWDTGTRRESKSDIDVLIDIIRSIDADGIFLDTMKDAPDFREKLDKVKPGIVMEGEISLPLEHLQSHHMSWAQWFNDSYAPGVYRNKWFEHCHMQHAIDRWNDDKTAQLHTAWMNGSGMLIWENVFGQWLGWKERDKSVYRTMYFIQHKFAELFSEGKWIPLSELSEIPGVFLSSWKDEGIHLRTLVNRNEFNVEGVLLKTTVKPDMRCYDLVKGEEISGRSRDGSFSVNGNIGGREIACILSIDKNKVDDGFLSFLSAQKKLFQIRSDDTSTPVRNNQQINVIKTIKYTVPLKNMKVIPPVSLSFDLEYTFRETGAYGNIQEHLLLSQTHKLHTPCLITRNITIERFAIDETPVTNTQFKEFIESSGYIPLSCENYLKHWKNGSIPEGLEDHPVVYVGPEDARAYAVWSGKRLPDESEWQYAAQGPQSFIYPWGNEMEKNRCNPNLEGTTTSVRAFPKGTSPFGCFDMCGNTWELTGNEYNDGRTRFVILKGGSCYKALGSEWYMDGGPQKNRFISKMLLMWPGLDRCSTVGFRCAIDLK